jgi:hypothetical protein
MRGPLFVCHASEDKPGLVRPLTARLSARGLALWYDEISLQPGDSLRREIDRGLREAEAAVIVLSPAFFSKEWAQWELDGLIQRRLAGGVRIIPIWHGVTHAQVAQFSPPLADLVALDSRSGLDAMVASLLEVVGPLQAPGAVYPALRWAVPRDSHLIARVREVVESFAEPPSILVSSRSRTSPGHQHGEGGHTTETVALTDSAGTEQLVLTIEESYITYADDSFDFWCRTVITISANRPLMDPAIQACLAMEA